MAIDPRTIIDQAQCYVCEGVSLVEAAILFELGEIIPSGGTPNTRITEAGEIRITEDGNNRIIE